MQRGCFGICIHGLQPVESLWIRGPETFLPALEPGPAREPWLSFPSKLPPVIGVSVFLSAVLSSCLCSSPELQAHFFRLNVPPQPPSCRLQQVRMCLLLYLHPALSDMHACRSGVLEAASGAGGIAHSLPLSQWPGY